jgi:hypothetical protein
MRAFPSAGEPKADRAQVVRYRAALADGQRAIEKRDAASVSILGLP